MICLGGKDIWITRDQNIFQLKIIEVFQNNYQLGWIYQIYANMSDATGVFKQSLQKKKKNATPQACLQLIPRRLHIWRRDEKKEPKFEK